ncbi:hypothetical protein Aca07nite_63080 [Actinoplanes capillaceus]|uniref:Uncharacterized protein n=1 Tax=Actinoplanes campanulatus TaxID=113559 RepID=A0ABQ3WRV9_9ACTN|nr:hypothetical protein Aca07nite_63080 [Actinoplanes capillaceus]
MIIPVARASSTVMPSRSFPSPRGPSTSGAAEVRDGFGDADDTDTDTDTDGDGVGVTDGDGEVAPTPSGAAAPSSRSTPCPQAPVTKAAATITAASPTLRISLPDSVLAPC